LKTLDWKSILIDNQLKIIDCLKNQSENCAFLSGGFENIKIWVLGADGMV
jgi:hypothetical protein